MLPQILRVGAQLPNVPKQPASTSSATPRETYQRGGRSRVIKEDKLLLEQMFKEEQKQQNVPLLVKVDINQELELLQISN